MPENIIHCPQCQRQLRVPEEMVGRLVKCPTCSTQFTVSAAGQPSRAEALPPVEEPPAPRRREAEYEEPPYEDEVRPRRRARYEDQDDARSAVRSLVLPPAICMLVYGILVVVLELLILVGNLLRGKEAVKQEAAQFQFGPQQVDAQTLETAWPFILGLVGVLALIGLLVAFSGIQMMRFKTYGLALTGSIVAMLIFYPCCCVLGLPVGIWSIIILSRQDVKSAFE
jgi:predicted Zn finger-like uncharacterized protein